MTDPWVITSRERVKYTDQFKTLNPINGIVTGGQAKGFFLQSQLPPLVLGQIWALADTDSDGKMNINEFSIACKLINLKLRGFELPKTLPPVLISSLSSVGGTPTRTPTAGMSPIEAIPNLNRPMIPPQPVHQQAIVQPMAAVMSQQPLIPGMMGNSVPLIPSGISSVMPPNAVGIIPPMIPPQPLIPAGGIPVLPIALQQQPAIISGGGVGIVKPMVDPMALISPPTESPVILPALPGQTPPGSGTQSRSMSISEKAPSIESPNVEWMVKGPAKLKYTQLFNATDKNRTGYLTGVQARGLLMQSKLPQTILAQIWALSDMDSDGRLGCDEFVLAMYLCDLALQGEKIPTVLPLELIPPAFRKTTISRHGSVSAGGGSNTGSRHGSVSSQSGRSDGHNVESDPTAGLISQTSFEDKRKENFEKGQAELERRRKALLDIQRKEREERERKEREEYEKREKARLEVELRKQQELERQLQRQRELEQEQEEQRKRALEQKEAARKEMERQRQLEWENSRILEMQSQKQREQEKVLKLKAQNTTLTVELSTLNEKIKELSQKICDTRAGVTNVKTVIDGMRSTRDTQNSEMIQYKSRIKEQNQKLVQLSQEKAKLDAKNKISQMADASNAENANAAFTNKQIKIKQLQDRLENTKSQIDLKMGDIKSNDDQLSEIRAQLTELINSCEQLYSVYEVQRNQVLEMKNNRKNEAYSSAWGDNGVNSAWPVESAVSATIAVQSPIKTMANSSGVGTGGYLKYRALYEFFGRNEDEISFQPGDLILVPAGVIFEPGWLTGEINGLTGFFPETYVEKIDDEIVASATGYSTTAINNAIIDNNKPEEDDVGKEQEHLHNEIKHEVEERIVSKIKEDEATMPPASLSPSSETEATVPTDTGIHEPANGNLGEYYTACYPYESNEIGDLTFNVGELVLVIKKEGDWWTGTIGNRTGMFPSNYVQPIDQTAAVNTIPFNDIGINSTAENLTSITAITTFDEPKFNENNKTLSTYTIDIYNNGGVADTTHSPIQSQPPQSGMTEEAKHQAEADSEVSQINMQPPSNDTSDIVHESYSRPMSTTSTTRNKKPEIAQVIAPYEATSTEQLSLSRGQLIMIRKKTDSGWWEGELQAKGRRRQIGWFPATYVKVLQGGRNSGRNTPVSGARVDMTEQVLDKVISLYPYKALNDDELSFEKDDIISVLGRDEPEWWRGELNGITGLFPSNYVGPFVTSGNV